MKIVIVMEGGVIQDITSDVECEVMVIDHDTDGVPAGDLTRVDGGGDGCDTNALVTLESIEVAQEYVLVRHAVFKTTDGKSC